MFEQISKYCLHILLFTVYHKSAIKERMEIGRLMMIYILYILQITVQYNKRTHTFQFATFILQTIYK